MKAITMHGAAILYVGMSMILLSTHNVRASTTIRSERRQDGGRSLGPKSDNLGGGTGDSVRVDASVLATEPVRQKPQLTSSSSSSSSSLGAVKKNAPGASIGEGGDGSGEVVVPVTLWDEHGNAALAPPARTTTTPGRIEDEGVGYRPPRYLVGRIASLTAAAGENEVEISVTRPHLLRHVQNFTFDLGNPGQTTLVAEGCRGCHDGGGSSDVDPDRPGCPPTVPKCRVGAACWPSHPDEYLPGSSYRDAVGGCGNFTDSGFLNGTRVCSMCFDGGDHARYFTVAEADDLVLLGRSKAVDGGDGEQVGDTVAMNLGPSFRFGAMVRTVPLIDRIWSNVGLGYNSSFLSQTGSRRLLLHLRPPSLTGEDESYVVLNPSADRYANASLTAPYETPHQRVHRLEGMRVGNVTVGPGGGMDFFMDTGNGGISVADPALRDDLAAATDGEWVPDDDDDRDASFSSLGDGKGRNVNAASSTPSSSSLSGESRLVSKRWSPSTAPDLHIILAPGIRVTLRGPTWVISNEGRTIFVTYEKNVLCLPFMSMSGVDLVFDDVDKVLHVVGADAVVEATNPFDAIGANAADGTAVSA